MTLSLRILAMRNFIFLGLLMPIFLLGATKMEINNEAKQVIYKYAEIIDSRNFDKLDSIMWSDFSMSGGYDLNGLISLKFWEEDFYWISHHQNKLAGKPQIRADQLEHSELLLLEDGHCLKDHILDACKISSNSKHILKASSLVTLIQLVKGNMGSTLVPKMALTQLLTSHKDLSKSHLDEPGPHREIALIIRPAYTGIKNAELLQSLCKDVLTEHHF